MVLVPKAPIVFCFGVFFVFVVVAVFAFILSISFWKKKTDRHLYSCEMWCPKRLDTEYCLSQELHTDAHRNDFRCLGRTDGGHRK